MVWLVEMELLTDPTYNSYLVIKMTILEGGFRTALVTPLLDNREIDFRALEMNIEAQRACGARGIVLGGTTGSPYWLSEQEFRQLIRFAANRKRELELIVCPFGGAHEPGKMATLANLAITNGADALLVIPPMFETRDFVDAALGNGATPVEVIQYAPAKRAAPLPDYNSIFMNKKLL